MQTRTGEFPGTGEVRYRAQLGVGRTGDHLLELAEHERADLIVVGTHLRRGLGRLTSVSSIVLHFGHASVACVPGAAAAARPAREIPTYRRVLIATDLSPISNDAVAYGYGLLRNGGGEVHLMHVVPAHKQPRNQPEEAALISELRNLVPPSATEEGLVTRTEVVAGDDPARAITETAERVGADVVCVASHGRTGIRRAVLGSTAEAVLRHSSRPVFVVRPLPD
jgi:nucleotide-binding universal stress UspA family protein